MRRGDRVLAESRCCRLGRRSWPSREASRLAEAFVAAWSLRLDRRQKVPDGDSDLVAVRFESEVSCIKKRNLRVLDVTLENLRACGHEERVSSAPDRQQRRLVLTKVLLELRIHIDIARIVEKQVQLYLVRAGSGHVVVVKVVAVRRNH